MWSDDISKVITLAQDHELLPPAVLLGKLAEEVGELSQVVLYENGYQPHKEAPDEDMFGEAADVINVVLCILAKQYPNVPVRMIETKLQAAFIKKLRKYETKVLKVSNDKNNKK